MFLICNILHLSIAATGHYNDTLHFEILQRKKRFLLFPPSTSLSVIKIICGYLGPIDIPLWQNINCARNFQFQYFLPASWITNGIPTWADFGARSLDNNQISDDSKPIEADNTRKVAYELIEDILNR